MPDKTTQSRKSKWLPEFDEELRRDWSKGVPLLEFARRFGYAKGATGRIKERAVHLRGDWHVQVDEPSLSRHHYFQAPRPVNK